MKAQKTPQAPVGPSSYGRAAMKRGSFSKATSLPVIHPMGSVPGVKPGMKPARGTRGPR